MAVSREGALMRSAETEKRVVLNRFSFINNLTLRTKINLSVAMIFALVVTLVTTYNVQRETSRMMEQVKLQATDLTTMYFDSLNTLMLTGTMDQQDIVADKMLGRENVIEARSVRGAPVAQQYGPGHPQSAPVDELDRRALRGEDVSEISERNGERVITIITPFKATEDTRGVDCLQCHSVARGAINGAVRLTFSLAKLDKAVAHEVWMSIIGNVAFFVVGLLMVNMLLKSWIITPLMSLVQVLNKRTQGDLQVRAAVSGDDELGQLALAFNNMADIMDEAATRDQERTRQEQEAATVLRQKVDSLLAVVSKVAKGDYTVRVGFSGSDAIGELAQQLQTMINYIHDASEEKREALESLQRRVDRILTVVTKASEGDLTGELDVNSDDAMGKLAAGIQRMMANLNGLVTQVQRSGIQVASSATSIAATAKEQEATVAEQAATTNEIVTTATEISATSKELVSTMDQVAKVAESTARSAQSGRAGLERMESTMRQIVEASGSISSKFEVLNEKAANINTVVTTITKVADQTNLLSLNAAIEAEKAGEYGFGFSVVAKEIRRLADQTAVATLDIEQMVKEMQTAVSSGVMSMEKFSQQVRHSVDDVRDIGSQLAQIIEQVQTLTPRFESVHQGMHFQSQGAEHINQSMIQLNEAAQQTVESLKESNMAIGKLNEAAHNLQQGVTRFKVKAGS